MTTKEALTLVLRAAMDAAAMFLALFGFLALCVVGGAIGRVVVLALLP